MKIRLKHLIGVDGEGVKILTDDHVVGYSATGLFFDPEFGLFGLNLLDALFLDRSPGKESKGESSSALGLQQSSETEARRTSGLGFRKVPKYFFGVGCTLLAVGKSMFVAVRKINVGKSMFVAVRKINVSALY
ncbi:hypothetical protein POM88_054976 [Heracleum sosnowskyi]|uniref:Uncharacterized protein n=1 Tax=Heracleum sosnowskyi TaxID=360622 RepID=A0AAD8LUD2_9APIA|nr:hypothetical protein POM88_054976 [Heracleum sosnowskyi]